MHDGTIKLVEDVQVGDLLMGDDSTPRTVLSTCTGQEMLYSITPIKGDSWVCNKSHILSLVSNSDDVTVCGRRIYKNDVVDVSVKDYLELNSTSKKGLKQYRVPVTQFGSSQKELPLDPWVFGVWLGDGGKCASIQGSGIYHLNDSNKVVLSEKISSVLQDYGYVCRSTKETSGKGIRLFVAQGTADTNFLVLTAQIMGGHPKCKELFIPHEYKTASFDDRLKLLAGLLDSDGYYQTKSFGFTTSSKQLAQDVCFLARSLGYAAYSTERTTKANGKPFTSYRVSLSGNFINLPVTRFQIEDRKMNKSVLRGQITVEPIGVGDYYGFELDGNHRYLLGDFTVTHNTIGAAYLIAHFPKAYIIFVTPTIDLARQTITAFESLGLFQEPIGLVGDGIRDWQRITVGVVNSFEHAVTHDPAYLERVQVTVIDEVHRTSGMYLNMLKGLVNQYYVLGVSGTPWRNDSTDFVMEGVTGPFSLNITEDRVAAAGGKVKPYYIQIHAPNRDLIEQRTEWILPKYPRNPQILKVYNERITGNQYRNELVIAIVQYLMAHPKRTGSVLVLVKHIEHGTSLALMCQRLGLSVPFVYGKTKDRDSIIQGLNDGSVPIAIASSVFNMGVDIPNLQFLVLADANGNETTHVQQINRVLRNAQSFDKQHGFIIDLADQDRFFYKRAQKRIAYTEARYTGTNVLQAPGLIELKRILDAI
jgi:hypothetical protein